MSELLDGNELCERLGISRSKYHTERKRGTLKMFEVKRPIGRRRYSSYLVEQYLRGESPTRLGRRV